jgi:uncharacterized membrane protein
MINTSDFHPMVVHFPIALILTGFLADVVFLFFRSEKCLSKAGFYLMVLGAVAAIAAWTTGQVFTNEPSQGEILSIFEKHETGAIITMILMIIGAGLRIYLVGSKKEDSKLKWVVFGIYLLAVGTVSFTGLMGGTMVYKYMMSI